ncbi:MAG: REP-associated tyrosine transposase [Patescibacteria group bacterium]|nr:transposase [Candidatus Saccharibacteria bacterium]MDQ5963225.1 REP-associated tyrosine transposase [Patescibacteria group bacterium]
MPRRNVIKNDASEHYYHVYFRGGNRSRIFREPSDYEYMLKLFSRYLSLKESKNSAGISYPNYHNRVDVIAFCLMPNHVHLFVYQHNQRDLTEFMKSLLTSYSMYFNRKYKRTGPLYESTFKASIILDDAYFQHISRYIHLNPREWQTYDYSSLPYYLQRITDDWIDPSPVMNDFSSPQEYEEFMHDYEQNKELIDILKLELANGNEV